jgi:ABC-2 type transport system permease protein
MNGRIIRAIALKDLQEVRQNRMAWMPMLILPLIFCVILPALLIILPQATNMPLESMTKGKSLQELLASMPPALREQVSGLNEHQTLIVWMLGYIIAPMFLIMPIMVSSIIGSESFVGERERKTLEALLYTPATDHELFLGKVVAAVIPAVLVSWLSFAVYAVVLNLLGGPIVGRAWFPTPTWWPLMLWVTPAVSALGMIAAVLVSSRVRTFMEAYQTTGMLVLPVALLMIGQLAGVVYLDAGTTFVVGVVIWLIDAGLIGLALRGFSRAALTAKNIAA